MHMQFMPIAPFLIYGTGTERISLQLTNSTMLNVLLEGKQSVGQDYVFNPEILSFFCA